MIRVSLSDALKIVMLTAVIIFLMNIGVDRVTYGGRGGMTLEFTTKVIMVALAAEHMKCVVDPKHTVVMIGVRDSAI